MIYSDNSTFFKIGKLKYRVTGFLYFTDGVEDLVFWVPFLERMVY